VINIDPIGIEVEREEDGRFLASVPDLPGVMAYGPVEADAIRKAQVVALQIFADIIDSGEILLPPLSTLFSKCDHTKPTLLPPQSDAGT
jgi:predicted RNase H-like HicB family nuclease